MAGILGGMGDWRRGVFGLACILLARLPAQQATAANLGATPWAGWVRCTVDTRPPAPAGTWADGSRYVLGRQTGRDTWAVDLHLALAPGQRRTLDLAAATAAAQPVLGLPSDPLGHFGGWVSVNDVPLPIVALRADGAGWHVHLRGRIARMLVADVWLDWRPDEPYLARGEALLTASDPVVPDLTVTVEQPLRLQFGSGWVHVLGAGLGEPVVPAGTRFGDGQGRAVPVAIVWPQHVTGPADWLCAIAAAERTVAAVGVAELLDDRGSPRLPANWDALAWTRQHWGAALAGLHDWRQPAIGPTRDAAATGAQQDQTFVGGECVTPEGALVYWLSALKLAARPCHHRTATGDVYPPGTLDGVMWWMGRPHAATGNLLGKPRPPTIEECSGWNGPDREHWLYNGLSVAARVTGSHALQHLLAEQARLYLRSETLPSTRPTWFTSRPDAARAVGWAGLLVDHLWSNLEDRALAALVRERWVARWTEVYAGSTAPEIWDVRRDDPRLGAGDWWICWQQAVGAYGLDVAGERFGVAAARTAALRAAKAVLRDGWRKVGSKWLSAAQRPVSGEASFDGSFNLFGMSLAVATVLRHEPQNEQARSIWQQLVADADVPGELSWLPPELPDTLPPIDDTPPPAGATAAEATHGAFRWAFSTPRPVGRFCTGEPWVVGPVTITAIEPAPVKVGSRQRNGSTLNPTSCANGYDSSSFWNFNDGKYQAARNVSLQLPLTIQTGSLVSALSSDEPADERGQVGFLLDAAVLTVLDAPPPPDAFRPSYVGTDKSIPGTLSQVDWSALAALPPAPGMPDLDDLRERLSHLWLDHCTDWVSRYLHVRRGVGDYYRGFTSEFGTAALAVNCAGVPEDVRRELTVRLIQIGIDNYAVVKNGARWGVNGHCNGRKFPVLFAGRLLQHAGMLAAGVDYAPGTGRVAWSEDGQVFYVSRDPDGRINGGFGGYTEADLGLPDWGNFHAENRGSDDASWPGVNGYRVCCSANGWVGQTLAMRIMGLRDEWAVPAYFDYLDRYMQWTKLHAPDWQRAWEPWHARMWDAYRGEF